MDERQKIRVDIEKEQAEETRLLCFIDYEDFDAHVTCASCRRSSCRRSCAFIRVGWADIYPSL